MDFILFEDGPSRRTIVELYRLPPEVDLEGHRVHIDFEQRRSFGVSCGSQVAEDPVLAQPLVPGIEPSVA